MKHPADEEIDKIIKEHLGHDPILVRYRELVDKKYLHGILDMKDTKEFVVLSAMLDMTFEGFYRPILDKLKEAS